MTFRVMAGFSSIWAGNARELKDGSVTMPGKRYNVTEDVLAAATEWLIDKNIEWVCVMESGRKYILNVRVEEAKE